MNNIFDSNYEDMKRVDIYLHRNLNSKTLKEQVITT